METRKDSHNVYVDLNEQADIKADPFLQEAKDDPFLSPDYSPHTDQVYMSLSMLAYFKRKLMHWREQLQRDTCDGIHAIQEQVPREPDNVDCAVLERDRDDELQRLKKDEELMFQIDAALERIKNGTYGFCEETADPIGIERLEAWPIATVTTQVQTAREKIG